MVSEIGQLRSDIVTCHLCFSVDLDVATFIFPSALDIDCGYAANSKANTSSKLISRELASITILHVFKYQCRLTNTNELCVGPDVTSICRMLYICIYIYFDIQRGPGPRAPLVMPMDSTFMSLLQIQELWPF